MRRFLAALGILIALVSLALPALADESMLTRWQMWRMRARCVTALQQLTTVHPSNTGWWLDSLSAGQVVTQPMYGTPLRRVGGINRGTFLGPSASGTALTQTSGTWGFDNRHHYGKDQAWNDDETLYYIQNPRTTADTLGSSTTNNNGTGSTFAILDVGAGYTVTNYFQCGTSMTGKSQDNRWVPGQPDQMLVLLQTTSASPNDTSYDASDSLAIVNVRTCAIVRSTRANTGADDRSSIGIKAYLIGHGEGTITRDGRYVALATNHNTLPYTHGGALIGTMADTAVVFDLQTMTRGPFFVIPADSLDQECNPDTHADKEIGHVQLSVDGNYLIVHYAETVTVNQADSSGCTASSGPFGADTWRVFPVNRGTMTIGPNPVVYSSATQICNNNTLGGNKTWALTAATYWSYGWGKALNHPDVAYNPFTGHEVVCGGRRCGGSLGHLEMFDLQTGSVTYLSQGGGNEASVHHVSARNYKLLGYVFCSYQDNWTTKDRFEDIMMYPLDGSGNGVQIGNTHTRFANDYRSESHLVPSPYGHFVAFASNWKYSCTKCMGVSDATRKISSKKDYVIDLTGFCVP